VKLTESQPGNCSKKPRRTVSGVTQTTQKYLEEKEMPQMTIRYMRLDNHQLPGGTPIPIPVIPDDQLNWPAPLTIADPTPEDWNASDTFLFWNFNGEIFTTPGLIVTIPSTDFTATAWYAGGGPGQERVITVAFSTDQDRTLPDLAIQSVSPGGSPPWDGSSNVVFNSNTPVTITAKSQVPDDPLPFVGWTKLEDQGRATSTGPLLTVPEGQFCLAIANYGVDPCMSIKQELAAVQAQLRLPHPPGTETALLRQQAELLEAVNQCEALHS